MTKEEAVGFIDDVINNLSKDANIGNKTQALVMAKYALVSAYEPKKPGDKMDLHTALQNIFQMFDHGGVHWLGIHKFNDRDAEELRSLLQYVHSRAVNMLP